MAGTRKVTIEILGDARSFNRAVNSTERSSSRLGGTFGKLGRLAGVAAVSGIAAVGVALQQSVSKAMTFDKTMRTIGAMLDVNGKKMKDLSALALKMGKDTVFSADDASQAMLELAKSGMSAATIQAGALESALTLAAAGGLDMATSATIMANTLNTFQLKAKDSASVAAALAGGANASSASVESLATALGYVGQAADNAGLSVQDTTAALAALDQAGVKGSRGGTSLRALLQKLVPQTEAASGAMAELGLNFTKANGEFLTLPKIAGQLQKAFKGLTDEQKAQSMQTIFGTYASSAANVLMKEGAAGIQKWIKATSDQTAAQKMANVSMGGAAGAWENLKGSIETLMITLGVGLLPAFTKIVNLVNDQMGPAIEFVGALFKKNGGEVSGFGKVIQRLFNWWTTSWIPMIKGIFTKAMEGARSAFKDIGDAIERNRPTLEALYAGFKSFIDMVVRDILPVLGPLLKGAFIAAGKGLAALLDIIGMLPPAAEMMLRTFIIPTVSSFLWFAKTVVDAAASAFGWIPGLGGKLREAQDTVHKFADVTNATLNLMADNLEAMGEKAGENLNKGLARGIRKSSNLPAAEAQGMANKVKGMMNNGFEISSPSKWAIRVGEYVGKGLAIGLMSGGRKAKDAARDLLAQMKDHLSHVRQMAKQFQQGIAGTIRGSSLLSVNQGDQGNGFRPTGFSSVSGQLQAALSRAKTFSAVVRRLTKAGVSRGLIDQVLDMGPGDGTTLGKAILSGGASGINDLNRMQRGIDRVAHRTGRRQANVRYGDRIDRAEAGVRGIRSVTININGSVLSDDKKIADAVLKALRKAGNNGRPVHV